jgi:hypothetical protein
MVEFDLLKQLVASAEEELAKAEGGNKAAGTRVRKAMQDIKSAAQAIRQRILEMRDAEPKAEPPAPPPPVAQG